ncbi:hypothetical protein, partial [Nocardia abscessus]|uniref:hypothetical protein n=1 Tax=Nocardia abscessus TaxID=120957 RepID=UPI00245856B8
PPYTRATTPPASGGGVPGPTPGPSPPPPAGPPPPPPGGGPGGAVTCHSTGGPGASDRGALDGGRAAIDSYLTPTPVAAAG